MTTDADARPDQAKTITRFFDAIAAGDSATLLEILTPDAVTRWPQSGERMTGALSCVRVHENYPGGTAQLPLRAHLRLGRHVGRRDDPEVRRGTVVRREHHRVRRTPDRADDRLLRTVFPRPRLARAVGRAGRRLSMNVLRRAILLLGLIGGLSTGCSAGLAPIPSGAQQVHVTDTDTSLRLEPATVRAGDVYVVLDGPRQNVVMVSEKRTAEATPGPMSDDDLDRLRRGDTEGTSTEGISPRARPSNAPRLAGRWVTAATPTGSRWLPGSTRSSWRHRRAVRPARCPRGRWRSSRSPLSLPRAACRSRGAASRSARRATLRRSAPGRTPGPSRASR